ncbi:hypothetical protein L6R50_09185 [Myxococcota bacterium]|nr:hypothetical protein [Myxococcota bacterium]
MPATANDTPRARPAPPWLEAARDAYGETFGARSPKALGVALDDWSELSVDEQTFTVGRLLYLNLLAHRSTQRLLEKVVAGLDSVADAVAGFDGPGDEDDDEEEEGEPAPAASAGAGPRPGPVVPQAGASPRPEPPVPPAAPAAAPEPAVEVEVLDPEDATPFDQEGRAA